MHTAVAAGTSSSKSSDKDSLAACSTAKLQAADTPRKQVGNALHTRKRPLLCFQATAELFFAVQLLTVG